MLKDLEKFLTEVNSDPSLYQQFQSLADREGFISLAVKLGNRKGYHFTTSDLEATIAANTASGQGDYFCLPIGCWHKPA